MTYTMTFDASHKVGRDGGHVTAFVRHIARDADAAAGFQFGHSNPKIDATRTDLNKSFVNDGAGGFRLLRSVDGASPSDELRAYLDERLATVTKPLRKDAVLLRGLVLQLDPKWFDQHNPDWRENGINATASKFINAAWTWAADEFGHKNIIGGSLHLDEHSPQLQLAMTPVTSDGRLSQKDYFRGPADLKRQHRELRDRMEAAGYDVERTVTERSREHLSSSEFAARAIRAKRAEAQASADLQAAAAERAEAADALRLAAKARAEAEGHTALQTGVTARLQALAEQIAADLEAAGPRPQPPDYHGLKRSILDRQSNLAMRFIRTFPTFGDGSTLAQRFERFARTEFARFVRERADNFGACRGPDFDRWQSHTVATRRKIIRGLATQDQDVTPARARNLDRSYGD
ncbi:plasmid recombination protein [Microbacterium oxydans]|uniref:plasmid recombination protein n=1 Tax=Microbacterium oxydans TaxID=82380 RepID=UPI003670B1DF